MFRNPASAPRPGRIDSIHAVPLGPRRSQDMKLAPGFVALDIHPDVCTDEQLLELADRVFLFKRAVRETAYRWNFNSDRVDWAPNAQAVLCVNKVDLLEDQSELEKLAPYRALGIPIASSGEFMLPAEAVTDEPADLSLEKAA